MSMPVEQVVVKLEEVSPDASAPSYDCNQQCTLATDGKDDVIPISQTPIIQESHELVDEVLESYGLTTVRKVKIPKGNAKKRHTVEETKIYLNTRRVYLNGELWKLYRPKFDKMLFYGTHFKHGLYVDDILYGLLSRKINVVPFIRFHCIGDRRTHGNNFEDGNRPDGYDEKSSVDVFLGLMSGLKQFDDLDYTSIHTIRREGFGKNYYDKNSGRLPDLTDFEVESIFPEAKGKEIDEKDMNELVKQFCDQDGL